MEINTSLLFHITVLKNKTLLKTKKLYFQIKHKIFHSNKIMLIFYTYIQLESKDTQLNLLLLFFFFII